MTSAVVRMVLRSHSCAAAALGALMTACAAHATDATFTDVTFDVGINTSHAPSALLEGGASILGTMSSGGVVGDFDRDGDMDLFVVVGGQFPDALYINNGDGTFTNKAAEWGVAVKHMGLAAAVGDYDNDGWPDIFVTSGGLHGTIPGPGKHRLYHNTGLGSFQEVAVAAGVNMASPNKCDGMGAAFGDYDLDGDLDLFVTGWLVVANGNRLFRNNGNGTFTDVTVSAGLNLAGVRGFSPRFVDMNGDRYPELLLAADFGTSRYYRNNGNGTFTNGTTASGTGLDDNGMGQTVGDLDNDGHLDWLVTSIFSLGNPETPGTGNMLYHNIGPHTFEETSVAAGINNGNWGWGVSAVDLNNDGRLDLVQTDGWAAYPEFSNQPARVWINQGAPGGGTPTFIDVAAACGLWHTLQGRGLLSFDYDNDGDEDVVIFANKDKVHLFRNDLQAGADSHWLKIRLDSSGGVRIAPDGAGAVVRVNTGTNVLMRHLDMGTNFESQNEMLVHVGLGTARSVDVRVDWPDGTATLLDRVAADQAITIASGERSDLDHDGAVGASDLGTLLAAWGAIDPHDERDLNADGVVDAVDLGVLLWNWTG